MAAFSFTNAQITQVTAGNGELEMGTPLTNVGPIKGNATLDITRKILQFKAGIPQVLYKQLVTDEDCFFKGTIVSWNLTRVQQALGIGVFTPITAGSTPATAVITFNDPDPNGNVVGELLGAYNILTSPSVVVSLAVSPFTVYS